jgi:hypothetical protein
VHSIVFQVDKLSPTMVRESEPLFNRLQTTDDDDDVELANDGGPSTRYRDDPSPPRSDRKKDDGAGPETRYKDDPSASIFNWDDGGGGGGGDGDDGEDKKSKDSDLGSGDVYQINDGEINDDDVGFSPVSLHDDDDDDDEGGGENGRTIRAKANVLLKKRVFDDKDDYNDDDDDDDGDDDRIFVGGGWGRHGSRLSWCPRGICSCCRGKPTYSKLDHSKPPAYSRGPPSSTRDSSVLKAACLTIAFLVAVVAFGYLGYQAGLPVDDDADGAALDGNGTTGVVAISKRHPHTKGEEWLEASSSWVEHEKEIIHNRPHWNFPRNKKWFNRGTFEPMTQSDLLKLSENVFQSCSERSLQTTPGRDACLSLCHGHYCCFEKEAKFGGCVSAKNSYCFAYAACESVIGDFMMTNANVASTEGLLPGEGVALNALDAKLLEDACSMVSVATLDGIRDCNAFCQHHLCCFSGNAGENCFGEHAGECLEYGACRTLVDPVLPEDLDTNPYPTSTPGVTGGDDADSAPSPAAPAGDSQGGTSDGGDANDAQSAASAGDGGGDGGGWGAGLDSLSAADELAGGVADGPGDDGGGGHHEEPVSSDAGKKISAIASAVQAVCGLASPGDDTWVTACHALCANYLCCFSTDGTTSNCRDALGDAACDAYQACTVLLNSPNDPEEEAPHMDTSYDDEESPAEESIPWEETEEGRMNEIYEACLPRARVDPNLADRCRKACNSRSCCWLDGPGNCASLNEGWCGEYEPCKVILSP